jgi:2-keto-4-pentenoate hydratase
MQALYDARAHGRGAIDAGLDIARSEALDLQLAVLDRFVEDGDAVGGWKVSFTSGRSRDLMGRGFRPFGYILRSRIFASGATIRLTGSYAFALEPELCLVLDAPLSGPVDRDTARAAVAGVAPAFEINQGRLPPEASDAARLADGTGNWGVVVGTPDPAAVPSDTLADTAVHLYRGDAKAGGSPGTLPDMDDPFASLAALSAQLGEHGRALRAGDHVITGAFARAAVTGPGRWRATFGGVGEVAVDIAGS